MEAPIEVVKNTDWQSENYAFNMKLSEQVAHGTDYAKLLEAKEGAEDE